MTDINEINMMYKLYAEGILMMRDWRDRAKPRAITDQAAIEKIRAEYREGWGFKKDQILLTDISPEWKEAFEKWEKEQQVVSQQLTTAPVTGQQPNL